MDMTNQRTEVDVWTAQYSKLNKGSVWRGRGGGGDASAG